jgi:hypothetical protein
MNNYVPNILYSGVVYIHRILDHKHAFLNEKHSQQLTGHSTFKRGGKTANFDCTLGVAMKDGTANIRQEKLCFLA